MKKMTKFVPAVRLSDKERMIVRYIVTRLEAVYRDTNGKPVYARNIDQVVKDMWGIENFTKTLRKARYNEAIMISLMKNMDTNTLWMIVRSKEHYKILCYMVAMDHHIVRLGKKYNKLCDLDPVNRPTGKMRKLQKEIKKSKKVYKACISTMREIFDIEKVGGADSGSALRDIMGDWLERHDTRYDDDIFFDLGSDYGLGSIESMDEYVAQHMRGGRRPQAPAAGSITGALGIFGDSDFDEEEDDMYDPEGYGDVHAMLRSMGGGRPAPAVYPPPVGATGYYPPAPAQPMAPGDAAIVSILKSIQDGFDKLNGTMTDFLDSITEPAEEEVLPMGNPDPSRPSPDLSVAQMQDISDRSKTEPEEPPQE